MAVGSSTSSILPATQDSWQQLRLQQTRRDVERAEQTAQSLQTQAQDAQGVANRAEEVARSLSVQADRAQSSAAKARQDLALGEAQTVSERVSGQSSRQIKDTEASVRAGAASVINTQGQVTGQVVNTTA